MARVIAADDEKAILSVVRQILQHEGHAVEAVEDGQFALEAARREAPDLVLLDIQMPRMTGYEVCQALKSDPAFKHIPVLLMTSHDANEERVKGLNIGADDFIGKPFNHAELTARVRAFLRTKRLHDEVQENYRKLKELEEMRDGLMHMIVHDLKAPLTSVLGGVDLVAELMRKNDPRLRESLVLLDNANQSCRDMSSLIDDILTVSKMEERKLALNLAPVKLDELGQRCLAQLLPIIKDGNISIVQELEPVTANADELLIQRVLMNLLSNSAKFTPEGGTIRLSVRRVPGEPWAECMVADSGGGIPQEYLEKVFDKFFQTGLAKSRKGQGLGLTFCRMAVEAHGGRIWAESQPGQGSRFLFRLPL